MLKIPRITFSKSNLAYYSDQNLNRPFMLGYLFFCTMYQLKMAFCLLPIFFLIFQGTFSVYEKLRQVEEFVSDSLEHALPFVLIDSATGQRLDDDSTKDSTLIGKLIRL